MSGISGAVSRGLTFIRFSHTLFALPFALGSMLAASRGRPGWRIFALIVLAMVFARTAAMVFNRLADWEIDQRNPRTAGRHRLVRKPLAQALLALSSLAFLATAYVINALCFALSPAALGIVFFYSLTKRFTHYTQIFLGLALAVFPCRRLARGHGAFLRGAPLVLGAGVLCWVAGFDLIYATMDYDFDVQAGLAFAGRETGRRGQPPAGAGLSRGRVGVPGRVRRLRGVGRRIFRQPAPGARGIFFTNTTPSRGPRRRMPER